MLGLMPVININVPLQPLPAGEVSKWPLCSLNTNNLNLQIHRHMGTRLERLCFLALYGNFQRRKLQPTKEVSPEGGDVSRDLCVSLCSLQNRTALLPPQCPLSHKSFGISNGLNPGSKVNKGLVVQRKVKMTLICAV